MNEPHLMPPEKADQLRLHDLGLRIGKAGEEYEDKKEEEQKARDQQAQFWDAVRDPELGDTRALPQHWSLLKLKIGGWTVLATVAGAALERVGILPLLAAFTSRTIASVGAWFFAAGLIFMEYIIGRHFALAIRAYRMRRFGSQGEIWTVLGWCIGAVVAVTVPVLLVLSPYWGVGFPRRLGLFLAFQLLFSVGIHSISIKLGNDAAKLWAYLHIHARDGKYNDAIHKARHAQHTLLAQTRRWATEMDALMRRYEHTEEVSQ